MRIRTLQLSASSVKRPPTGSPWPAHNHQQVYPPSATTVKECRDSLSPADSAGETAMMGFQGTPARLFYDFCLDEHVPAC